MRPGVSIFKSRMGYKNPGCLYSNLCNSCFKHVQLLTADKYNNIDMAVVKEG
jgi:hypothetical protein